MLVFVIPLKSKEASKSWSLTCQLLERCLHSVCNQTDPDFRAVVVCNQLPDLKLEHPNIDYVQVDFNVPQTLSEKRQDRTKKVMVGVLHARKFSPNHVMITDADDCVSCHIAKFTNQHPEASGWVVNKGYVYQENSKLIYYRKSHFYKWCGTCNIVKFDLCPLPESEGSFPEELMQYYWASNHKNIKDQLKGKGYLLENLPFAGAIYIIGHGENVYQSGFSSLHNANRGNLLFFIKELIKFRLVTPSIRKDFSLYKIPGLI